MVIAVLEFILGTNVLTLSLAYQGGVASHYNIATTISGMSNTMVQYGHLVLREGCLIT